jgi:hypothetical protein
VDIKIRPLKTKDIFPMSRILKKINLKEALKEAIAGATSAKDRIAKDQNQTRLGVDLVMLAFENLHLAEDEVNAFLADLAGLKPAEFAELEFEAALAILDQLKGQKAFASFLQQAAK